jgi:hypothetical protein
MASHRAFAGHPALWPWDARPWASSPWDDDTDSFPLGTYEAAVAWREQTGR